LPPGLSDSHLRNIHLRDIQIKNSQDTNKGALNFNYCDDISVIECKFL